jgi:hypothetical protein
MSKPSSSNSARSHEKSAIIKLPEMPKTAESEYLDPVMN